MDGRSHKEELCQIASPLPKACCSTIRYFILSLSSGFSWRVAWCQSERESEATSQNAKHWTFQILDLVFLLTFNYLMPLHTTTLKTKREISHLCLAFRVVSFLHVDERWCQDLTCPALGISACVLAPLRHSMMQYHLTLVDMLNVGRPLWSWLMCP